MIKRHQKPHECRQAPEDPANILAHRVPFGTNKYQHPCARKPTNRKQSINNTCHKKAQPLHAFGCTTVMRPTRAGARQRPLLSKHWRPKIAAIAANETSFQNPRKCAVTEACSQ